MRLVVCVMLWALALAPGLLVPGAQARTQAASPFAGAQEPGSALNIAPESAPEAAPDAVSEVVSDVGPGAAPEVAPEVVPDAPRPRAVNPFTGATRPGAAPAPARVFDAPGEAGPGSGLLAALARTQRELRQGLSERVRALRDGGSASGLAVFLALAFAYGALHAAGPGHGKAVAVSYVLARGEGPGRAALLGAVMGTAHAASAVALVLGLYLILERSLMARFTAQGLWLERASYALVCAIAVWLLARAVRGQGAEQGARGAAHRGLWATGLATGLVPCPGAAIVLLFALALGAPGIGLGAVAAMALGMGATIATAAALAALCRQRVTALAATRPRRAAILDRALSILGALAALTLGATLLAGSLG
ncbi:nickel/cobalt transporter [Desulfocurvus vexinensis]|uniref:nickel/cobalt transporter n=1 Tax=Desulfocurvus vexinensis TaxID=399548 RepID=UPI00048A4F3D|nr:hypothetical protein [Desulfocurvus vexinensis]